MMTGIIELKLHYASLFWASYLVEACPHNFSNGALLLTLFFYLHLHPSHFLGLSQC